MWVVNRFFLKEDNKKGGKNTFTCVACHPKDDCIATGHEDGKIRLWWVKLATRPSKCVHTPADKMGKMLSITIFPQSLQCFYFCKAVCVYECSYNHKVLYSLPFINVRLYEARVGFFKLLFIFKLSQTLPFPFKNVFLLFSSSFILWPGFTTTNKTHKPILMQTDLFTGQP